MGERKKIMVAIDESDVSHYALEWALNVLKPTINSPLLLFHAQPLPSFSYVYAGYGAARTSSHYSFLFFLLSLFFRAIHLPISAWLEEPV